MLTISKTEIICFILDLGDISKEGVYRTGRIHSVFTGRLQDAIMDFWYCAAILCSICYNYLCSLSLCRSPLIPCNFLNSFPATGKLMCKPELNIHNVFQTHSHQHCDAGPLKRPLFPFLFALLWGNICPIMLFLWNSVQIIFRSRPKCQCLREGF